MKTKIVTMASLFLLSTAAYSHSGSERLVRLENALQSFRIRGEMPVLKARSTPLNPNQAEIAEVHKRSFLAIQKFLFNSDSLISLKACDGCKAVAHAPTMTVYVDPLFFQSLHQELGEGANNLISFILAHELSHFTYEYITVSSSSGVSPNGNIPLLTKSFMDFVKPGYVSSSRQEQVEELKRYLEMASKAHADVDLLALLTLKNMNKDVGADVIKYLQTELSRTSHDEFARIDFKSRFINLAEVLGVKR